MPALRPGLPPSVTPERLEAGESSQSYSTSSMLPPLAARDVSNSTRPFDLPLHTRKERRTKKVPTRLEPLSMAHRKEHGVSVHAIEASQGKLALERVGHVTGLSTYMRKGLTEASGKQRDVATAFRLIRHGQVSQTMWILLSVGLLSSSSFLHFRCLSTVFFFL